MHPPDDAQDARRRPRGPRQPASCTMNACYFISRDREVPMLRLRGLWLEALGLQIGCTLGVTAEPGRLLFTLLAPPPAPSPRRPKRAVRRPSPSAT